MRLVMVGGLIGCLAAALWAQPRRTYGSRSGFGNVVFPGMGSAPRLTSPFSLADPTHARRLGASISGFPPYTGAPAGAQRAYRYPAAWPAMYPIFVGGYSYPPQPEQPPVVVISPPASQPAPVVINQYFSGEAPRQPVEDSGLRVYDAPVRPPAEPAEAPLSFLIATKDRSVFSAAAYWVEGETFHYVTPRGKHEQIPLIQVDRELSEKLNENHQVQFRLPAPK